MYIHPHTHTHACMHACTHAYAHIYARMHVHKHTGTCTRLWAHKNCARFCSGGEYYGGIGRTVDEASWLPEWWLAVPKAKRDTVLPPSSPAMQGLADHNCFRQCVPTQMCAYELGDDRRDARVCAHGQVAGQHNAPTPHSAWLVICTVAGAA